MTVFTGSVITLVIVSLQVKHKGQFTQHKGHINTSARHVKIRGLKHSISICVCCVVFVCMCVGERGIQTSHCGELVGLDHCYKATSEGHTNHN